MADESGDEAEGRGAGPEGGSDASDGAGSSESGDEAEGHGAGPEGGSDASERRTSPRHAAYIGAEIKDPTGPISAAITHDGSATGLLLLTRAKLESGQAIELDVFFVEGKPHHLTGKVVRQEALDAEENTLWRTKVAVHIEAPDAELGEHFEALAKEQERVYGGKLRG